MKREYKFPLNLFFGLTALAFVPFVYQIVRTNLIVSIPTVDGLSISGHIEWFDLINETIQAFLIIPLYSLLNKVISNRDKFKNRIFETFVISNGIYILFSLIILVICNKIVLSMTNADVKLVTTYLRLETVGFIFGNAVSFVTVLFVVLGKSKYVYFSVVIKTVCTVIGDLILIPRFDVNGVAYSNILVNIFLIFLCAFALSRERLFPNFRFSFSKELIFDYFKTGVFSGAQIFLDNAIYFWIVCKMVNMVKEQGNYWVANNFIWGLLLIPVTALSEIIRKDFYNKNDYPINKRKMTLYSVVLLVSYALWLILLFFLNPILSNIMGIENPNEISRIIKILVPFYFAYGVTQIFDNIIISCGKTVYLFIISVVVNLVYYPIVYILVKAGTFSPDITFICLMFGFGMVVHLALSSVIWLKKFHTSKKVLTES